MKGGVVMRKLLIGIGIVASAVILTACGKDSTGTSVAEPQTSASEKEQETSIKETTSFSLQGSTKSKEQSTLSTYDGTTSKVLETTKSIEETTGAISTSEQVTNIVEQNTTRKPEESSKSKVNTETTTRNQPVTTKAKQQKATTKAQTVPPIKATTKPAETTTIKKEEPTTPAPTQPTTTKVKSIYEYPFDIEAIKKELIAYGESFGVPHSYYDGDELITPENYSWGPPDTILKGEPEKLVKKQLFESVRCSITDWQRDLGEQFTQFTLYFEEIEDGYIFYVIH